MRLFYENPPSPINMLDESLPNTPNTLQYDPFSLYQTIDSNDPKPSPSPPPRPPPSSPRRKRHGTTPSVTTTLLTLASGIDSSDPSPSPPPPSPKHKSHTPTSSLPSAILTMPISYYPW
ncbi:hypothetical protein CFE70_003223 [Pyrenophora teres f. teres 0-1]|uniref:Uncharacterized protein n=1 Tax=Pyrenophora teres f. teres (strain 0-1) TaxID=861557 RepID=E3RPS5_PYRTT|nr:hypothetical protein PTT_10669 [Pyrenophora teres f. teres 0-1]